MIGRVSRGLWYDSRKNLQGKREDMSNKLLKLENPERAEELTHTPFGPSPEYRMSRERMEEIVCAAGFAYSDFFALAPNLAGIVFSKR